MMRFKDGRGPLCPISADGSSDRGSLLMALLVTLVGMALTAALVPIVVNQVAGTRVISGRIRALDVAQAGIDVAVGQLRAATDGAGKGILANLPPCQMTGNAGSIGSKFIVTIVFAGLVGSAAPACPRPGVPVTATLTSTGGGPFAVWPAVGSPVGSTGTRTIEATYTFKTNNENISGGAIQLATNSLCMDAGTVASPAPTTPVKMQPCKVSGSSDQRFAYTKDLNIKLVGSETSTLTGGMCLDAPVPHATNGLVTFQACGARLARQQWSLNNSSNFQGTGNGIALDNFCFNLSAPGGTGSTVVLGGCAGAANVSVFRPQPGVGAGMASVATGQLVNFKQFSRCLDVTNQVMSYSYMIVWFCKQAPDGNVLWNQKWTLPLPTVDSLHPITGRLRTLGSDGAGYCLTSPRSTATNLYVTLTSCPASGALTDAQTWVVYGPTPDYASSYRILDFDKHCLTPTDLSVASPDTHTDGTAKAKMAVCDSTELQKWNAPANLNDPLALTNTKEK
jgi:Ricin-type beta-trefoil lectin domain